MTNEKKMTSQLLQTACSGAAHHK